MTENEKMKRHPDRGYKVCEELHVCENCINLVIGTWGDPDLCEKDGEAVESLGTCNSFESTKAVL